jgi:hypothetical protein
VSVVQPLAQRTLRRLLARFQPGKRPAIAAALHERFVEVHENDATIDLNHSILKAGRYAKLLLRTEN